MTDYKNLIVRLRSRAELEREFNSSGALMDRAADAITELLKVSSAMHTWIFLNTGDEEAAYADCGLSPEMNAALENRATAERLCDILKEISLQLGVGM